MVYQQFVQIRPTKTKRAPEIAYFLIDIFCILGAPSVLHSDNGREFVNSTIQEIEDMWDGVKVVHGRPRQSKPRIYRESESRQRKCWQHGWKQTRPQIGQRVFDSYR